VIYHEAGSGRSHSYTPPPLPHSFRLAGLLALLSAVIVVLPTAVALVAVAVLPTAAKF
jgi:hypothetical protein